ncbi:MAG: YeeE/YedE family protein, partial [Alphaproteobacteria bacterium]|nr:YeeE/YedE family protein [Alphaproteobacteria bacterium]
MLPRRLFVALLLAAALLFTFVLAGPRAGLLMAIGIGFGLVLEGLRFGFAGPWRMIVTDRDGRGLVAQFLAIGLVASVAFPLLAAYGGELSPAHAPVGLGMILGAFVFGAAMQLVMGCGSGTLINAGSGNLVGLIALVGFIGGSFAGSLHLGWWTGLASLPVLSLQGSFGAQGGLIVTLAGLAALAALVIWRAAPGKRLPPARLWWAAGLIAALALANLVVAGQPWGIVYGLGLWGAKIAQAGGVEVAASGFWANPGNAERLGASILTDVTSLTNIGLLLGAFAVMRLRANPGAAAQALTARSYALVLLAGLVLGYSARM